jgi:translation initiation factor IF-3
VTEQHRINSRIRVKEVRVVGDNVESAIYPTEQALRMAREQGLDLVEISPTAKPPVCKIVDYSKFKYEQKKKEKEIKAKAQKTVVKEIRFGPNTSSHDLAFKMKHAESFLKEGNKVKAYVQFTGREIVYKDQGLALLNEFAEELDEWGKVEATPRMEGRRMIMMIAPKK